ncbi:alanyl-tRNA editing protein [Musicola paradisiaca]|uniref:Threonyl/alanyl tRNA synthetase SAD n=1 Tax=Musicola paradisiaca (strain Ech703) TaxID=579405 RepID=C6C9H7_MUSP7|nr:threonyl/alanyl tRNA synthetase SAD [Musicola paradisiaca]ACS84428.1 Threonyl/alanyl tRNA synthetase SAD [Musicola paradisiaca Ech703]
MTEKIYLEQDALSVMADVIECKPRAGGGYEVLLSCTPFHPQGGGQPADRGTIDGVAVTHVVMAPEGIWHFTDEPIAPGAVRAQVDGECRQWHSRWHSAGHLIAHIMASQGWTPVKAHHWPGEGRIEFSPGINSHDITVPALAALCSAAVAADWPCRVNRQQDGFRTVGFGEFTPYPCGGTHVGSLKIIGDMVITDVKNKKGKRIVHYDIR